MTGPQRSADVAKLHEDMQILMDARSAETTKQRQQVLTLELVSADLAAKAEQLTTCQTHLSDAQAQLSAATDETDRLKADLRESSDVNGSLRYANLVAGLFINATDVRITEPLSSNCREKCAEQTEQYAALQVELAEKSQLLAQVRFVPFKCLPEDNCCVCLQ